MDNIEYTEEEKRVVIATGALSLDDKLSEEEKRNRVFSKLEAEGYEFEDRDKLEIKFEVVDDESTNFEVIRVSREMVPYNDEMERLYSNSFILEPSMDEIEQKRKIFTMMQEAGIEIDPKADYEISYEEGEDYEKNHQVLFTVYKHSRERIDAEAKENAATDELMNAVDGIFYEEESEIEEIFSGSFILDGLRMTEEEQKKKVMKMMEDAGVVVEDDANIDIGYEGAEDFEDGMSTKFVVIKETKKTVPYRVVSEKVYSGEYILDEFRISPAEQREKVFDMMRADGISIDNKSELDIRYEGAEDSEDSMSTKFDVYRMKKVRVDENGKAIEESTDLMALDTSPELKSEVIEVEEIEMEEIVNGTLDLDGLETQEDIDNKVFEILRVSGMETLNVGEVKISYGEETPDRKLPFAVSRIIVEKVKYNVDKEKVGAGFKKEKEDIFAAVQRNQGLDIRLDPNYEIVYGQNNELGREYTLIKTKRTKLESKVVDSTTKDNEIIAAKLDDSLNKESTDIIATVDELYDKAKAELDEERGKVEADQLRKSLGTIGDIVDDGSVDELFEMLDSLENATLTASEMTDDFRKMFDDIDSKVKKVRKELKQAEKDYESAFIRMQELAKQELEEFENSGLLSEEEIREIREKYNQEKMATNEIALEVSKQVEQGKRQLTSLVRRKNKLEKEISKAHDLGLSVSEYRDTVKTDNKKKVLEKKELPDKTLTDMIEALYITDKEKVIAADARSLKTQKDVIEAVATNSAILPEKIVKDTTTSKSNYIPGEAPEDMVEVSEIKATKDEVIDNRQLEKIRIYVDDNNSKYVRKHVADRFNIKKGEEVKINNASFYKINDLDEDFLIENSTNDHSPYDVGYESVSVENIESNTKKKSRRRRRRKNREQAINENLNSVEVNNSDINTALEKIVVYVDLDNSKNYVKKNVMKRFNLKAFSPETRIQNALCYEIASDDLEFIVGNANNDYSPYLIEYREVHLGKEEVSSNENVEEENINDASENPNEERFIEDNDVDNLDSNSEEVSNNDNDSEKDSESAEKDNEEDIEEIIIKLYKDLNDNNQIYAGSSTLRMFGIVPTESGQKINDEDCYKINPDADRMINYLAKTSVNPKYIVEYENVKLKKKVKPHVESILDKITTGLEIKAKDAKKFNASKIQVAENFKNELRSGNVLYNIVHLGPAVAKASISFLKKMAGKLMSRGRVKTVMTELNRRLDEDLSEEELEVLFEEYRGSQLKTDMNNQINDSILQRLRKYGLEKAAKLNDKIKYSYTNIFSLLGQIKIIDQSLLDEELEEEAEEALMNERTNLVNLASGFVKDILVCRKDVNNLLSGGVHGLEEDFKAVATKLSYVGMRFAKTNDFDNELQHKLGEYGENLNEALSEGDNEAILDNFMGLESCYYKNTEVARSALGRRSVGSKYYSPLAEQFDYRDDPFIRDMITTVVFASAATSAINASLVHQFKSQELLKQQNADAANINAANDNIIDYVHQTGADIEGKRGVFQDGMEAQAHQDVLSSANMIERSSLDMSNWSFTDAYHTADEAGHTFFNGFSQDVTSKINDITAQYGSGAINQVEAIHQMAKVANSAQNTLVNVSNECTNILKTYAESHPQFDLSGIQDSIDYVVAHPNAISDMNQAMLDATNLAGGLEGLAINHVEALSSLPSDMASTLVCAASAAGLALQVSKSLNANYGKKGVYGNEITEMMDEYINDSEEEKEENKRKK